MKPIKPAEPSPASVHHPLMVNEGAGTSKERFFDLIRARDEAEALALLDRCPYLIRERDDELRGPLHIAVRANVSGEFVETLLNAGADVMAVDRDGNTALHVAASHAPREDIIFPHLISRGGMPLLECRNNEGLTPEDCASRVGDKFTVMGLQMSRSTLQQQAAGNVGGGPWQRLEQSVATCSLQEFQSIVNEVGGVNARRPPLGMTPLMCALGVGRVDLATWLADHGADINAAMVNLNGEPGSPCLAVAAADRNALRFMLERGADPVAPIHGRANALVALACGAPQRTLQLFLEEVGRHREVPIPIGEALIAALSLENGRSAAQLLSWQSGALPPADAKLALVVAVAAKMPDVIPSLLSRGADINIIADDGKGLLDVCTDARTRRVLLEHGAKPSPWSQGQGKDGVQRSGCVLL